jgi:hypothetical protein
LIDVGVLAARVLVRVLVLVWPSSSWPPWVDDAAEADDCDEEVVVALELSVPIAAVFEEMDIEVEV